MHAGAIETILRNTSTEKKVRSTVKHLAPDAFSIIQPDHWPVRLQRPVRVNVGEWLAR
jgi:hypothetical protein